MIALTTDNRNLADFEAWQTSRIEAMKRKIAELQDELQKAENRLQLADSQNYILQEIIQEQRLQIQQETSNDQ